MTKHRSEKVPALLSNKNSNAKMFCMGWMQEGLLDVSTKKRFYKYD